MKEMILMRVLFFKKRECPFNFMCFCKPSAAHVYNSVPAELENSVNVIAEDSEKSSSGVEEEIFKGEDANGNCEAVDLDVFKSCIRKPDSARKKRVQWKDKLGKELAEVKEFESSQTGDTDSEEEISSCLCWEKHIQKHLSFTKFMHFLSIDNLSTLNQQNSLGGKEL
ncbi:hypothetical protein STAS_28012 [Striga asiatica]|uniref:Uncharacterized protein n=1 Tax=Striga asiatica TaxID=4170 RepID=A0A5A7QZ23_STRAF|nr:hypothetical protein STAS_28012 [Striga asiatica]